VELESKFKALIDHKGKIECGDTALLYSSTYIRQLKNHISDTCILSNEQG